MGDTNEITGGEIQRCLRFRAQLSVAGVAALGAIGLVLIAIAAGGLDRDRVCLVVGVGFCQSAFMLIVAWGNASNHGMAARFFSKRFDAVEEFERKTGDALVIALDEVRQRRSQHGG